MPSDALSARRNNFIVTQFSCVGNHRYEAGDGPGALPSALPELRFLDGAYIADDRERPLRGVDVETPSGRVAVRPWNGAVRLEGDVDRLEVRITDSGVLAVRQKGPWPAPLKSFFPARVELLLPRRRWGFLQIATAGGGAAVEGGMELERLSVKTASGNLRAELSCCGRFYFRSASGSLECSGLTGSAWAESASGSIRAAGNLEEAELSSVSGGVELSGSVQAARLASVSGSVRLSSSLLPERMALTSKSGSCEARIPAERSFSLNYTTGSGQFRSDLPLRRTSRGVVYGGGGARAFEMSTVSGDIGLWRY